jgi:hypothetical protein
LRVLGERDLVGYDLIALTDEADDLRSHLRIANIERSQNPCRKPLLLAQQPEQDVLRTEVVVPERPRILLREHDDLPGTFGEPLEHLSGD